MKNRHQVNHLHPSEILLSKTKDGYLGKKSSTGSLQPECCSPFPACSSLAPPIYSRSASTNLSNPFPPPTSQHQTLPIVAALVPPTPLPSVRSITPARVPSISLTRNGTIITISTTMQPTITSPVQDITPAQAFCTCGTPLALLNQRHPSNFLLDPALMKSPSCQSLQPHPKQHLPCQPLMHHPIPHHVLLPAPLSSHLLHHPVALTNPVHLPSHRRSP